MMNKNSILLIIAFMISSFHIIKAQSSDEANLWTYKSNSDLKFSENRILKKMPSSYHLLNLNYELLKNEVGNINEQQLTANDKPGFDVLLPTPDGVFMEFHISENSVVAPEVAHLYTVKTFKGYSKDNTNSIIRCSMSETGFNAFVYDGDKSYSIEPLNKDDNTKYIVYYKKELSAPKLKCGHSGSNTKGGEDLEMRVVTPTSLRTYKLAYVSSGEFSQQFGGSPYSSTNVLDQIATGLNMVNPIYERDFGVTFMSVTNATLVFENPATDPFDINNQEELITINHTECVNKLGAANFDIGHLLVWENTGGLAAAGVCEADYKGQGFSGSNASMVSIFIDYSGHEIGHQFGGNHNFVSQECATSEPNFRFEPGEGSSIMSYAGACSPAESTSYQSESDPFFHSASINSVQAFIVSTATCHTSSTPGTGNNAAPVPDAKSDITIPKQTPFVLVGSATDGNDPVSNITYLWEQNDGGGVAVNGSPDCMSTTHPLFKYQDPVSENYRVLPEMNLVLAGKNNHADAKWEKLPCIARTINFNLIARDNNTNWGRTGNDQMIITVADTGPFAVTSPNGGETWNEGSTKTVTWSENGTASHCTNVDILLSTDNGSSFSVIASSVTNDGSHDITVPSGTSTTARVLVQCSTGGNFKTASTFFDVSDAVFNIEGPLPVHLVKFEVERNSDNKVNIFWTTATEINNSHFEVEKSRNGSDYFTLGTINSSGNSGFHQNYNMEDDAPFQGTTYYRLKQLDMDGTFEYSPIKSIHFSNSLEKIAIYPNPTNDIITIQIPNNESMVTIKVYDQLGRVLREILMLGSSLDISELPDGIYYVSVQSNHENYAEKILVTK